MTNHRYLSFSAAAMALGTFAFGPAAMAASASTTFNVNATVANACTVSATDIDFSTIGTGEVATSGASGVKVTCTADGTYDVGLLGTNAGSTTAGAGNLVNLAHGTDTPIPYALFQDAAATTVWGNVPASNTLAGQAGCATNGVGNCTGTGSEQDYQVWAKLGTVPGTLHVGNYADIVTVTVNYY